MFEQVFKNIDDILHKDAGCSSELDYVEQTSWLLFLKYLEDLEKDKKTAAELAGKQYSAIINREFKWETWAAPKGKDGKIDHHKALTGDDLKDFVDHKLFPYLKKFKTEAESPDTIEYKIGEIFSELKNKIQSGYNMREVINLVDGLRFRSHTEKHEMSALYEDKIQNMGNAGRNGGEYYTPRPLIKTIVKVVAPAIGEKVYDGAVGSAGFLCEAFEYLKASKNLTTKDAETLQKRTFYGKEKKGLAYIIGTMNMILHGVEAPNIVHTNTLAENLADIQERDRYDVVLANPPFGGKERAEVQQNFPIKTGETAFLFLQHFIKILKAGGRAGVVIKNTFLSNTDNASISLRKQLLESCNLHTVLDLPGGTFHGAGVNTVVLFFEKGSTTRKIWYYQLSLDRNLGKTKPLNEDDLAEFVKLHKTKAKSNNSWSVNIADVNTKTYDLAPNNPNMGNTAALREPQNILREMNELEKEIVGIVENIQGLESDLRGMFSKRGDGWKKKTLTEVCEIKPPKKEARSELKETALVSFLPMEDLGVNEKWIVPTKTRMLKDVEGSYTYFADRDVLLAKITPCFENGKLGIARNLKNGVGFGSSEYIVLRPNKELSSEFLYYYLARNEFRQEGAKRMMGAVGHKRVSKQFVENSVIQFPSIDKQNRIVAQLDRLTAEIQKLEAIYSHKLSNCEEIEQSILRETFSQGLIGSNA